MTFCQRLADYHFWRKLILEITFLETSEITFPPYSPTAWHPKFSLFLRVENITSQVPNVTSNVLTWLLDQSYRCSKIKNMPLLDSVLYMHHIPSRSNLLPEWFDIQLESFPPIVWWYLQGAWPSGLAAFYASALGIGWIVQRHHHTMRVHFRLEAPHPQLLINHKTILEGKKRNLWLYLFVAHLNCIMSKLVA